jgi:hypothetical protein
MAMKQHTQRVLLAWSQWTCTPACTRCAQQRTLVGLATLDMHLCLPARDVHSGAQSPSRPMCQQVYWPVAGASAISESSSHHAVSRGQLGHVLCHTSRRATPGMRAAIGFSRCTVCHGACMQRNVIAIGGTQLGATVGARGASTATCARRQAKINACAYRDRQRQSDRESVPSRMQRWSHSRDAYMLHSCIDVCSDTHPLARHPRSNTIHTDPGVLTMCCVSAPLGAR